MLIPGGWPWFRVPLELGCVLVVFPLLVLAGSTATCRHPKWLAATGDASFMLYGMHQPLLKIAATLVRPQGVPRQMLFCILFVVGAELLAIGLARGIEKPLLRRLQPARFMMARTTGYLSS